MGPISFSTALAKSQCQTCFQQCVSPVFAFKHLAFVFHSDLSLFGGLSEGGTVDLVRRCVNVPKLSLCLARLKVCVLFVYTLASVATLLESTNEPKFKVQAKGSNTKMITMINHDTAVSNRLASASSVPVKNSAIYLIGPTSLSTNLTACSDSNF